LAQRMVRDVLAMEASSLAVDRTKARSSLQDTYQRWRMGHERLLQGEAGLGGDIFRVPANQEKRAEFQEKFEGFQAAIQIVVQGNGSVPENLGERCDAYVSDMESLLFEIQRDSEARSMTVSWMLQVIVGLALLLIATEGVFVFRPLIVGLRGSFGKLREAHERVQHELSARMQAEQERDVLKGLLPICAGCKRIRDDEGQWQPVEMYIEERSEARFSHGLCRECIRRLYPERADAILAKIDEQDVSESSH